MQIPAHIKQALEQYIDEKATATEKLAVQEWFNSYSDDVLEWEGDEADYQVFMQSLKQRLHESIFTSEPERTAHRVHFLKTTWFRYAAVFIAIFGISSYLWLSSRHQSAAPTANNSQHKNSNADILPGGNKATLTLADGTQITLDNTANGELAKQGNTQVVKLADGQLAYRAKGLASSAFLLNTMTTPRGGQYKIQLPDGTNVWLNAASSITYPTAFTGKKREVMINGEAYFEVKSNKMQPFLVKTSTSQIQVLGTSFNINAYENEPAKTSLIEGSIKVNNQLLTPGEAYSNGKVASTDLEQDVAWKSGLFNFTNADLPTVMRQLERWYDIEVKYQATIPTFEFQGEMDRGVRLEDLLEAFKKMGLSYQLQGRILTILPE